MPYRCLKQQIFEEGPYKILPVREEDLGLIKEWRNDQISILRQHKLLTDEGQKLYWKNVLEPSFNEEKPSQVLFSFFKEDLLIGYGGLTHVDWSANRGEVSFLLETLRAGDSANYLNEFSLFLRLLKLVVFGVMKFHRMFAETYDVRPTHIAALENFGFIFEGRLKDHVKIEGKYYDSLIHGWVEK